MGKKSGTKLSLSDYNARCGDTSASAMPTQSGGKEFGKGKGKAPRDFDGCGRDEWRSPGQRDGGRGKGGFRGGERKESESRADGDWFARGPSGGGRDRPESERDRLGGARRRDDRERDDGPAARDDDWRHNPRKEDDDRSGRSRNDNIWRPSRERDDDGGRERPRLQLKPRSRPVQSEVPRDGGDGEENDGKTKPTKPDPFGGARPVSTRVGDNYAIKGGSLQTEEKKADPLWQKKKLLAGEEAGDDAENEDAKDEGQDKAEDDGEAGWETQKKKSKRKDEDAGGSRFKALAEEDIGNGHDAQDKTRRGKLDRDERLRRTDDGSRVSDDGPRRDVRRSDESRRLNDVGPRRYDRYEDRDRTGCDVRSRRNDDGPPCDNGPRYDNLRKSEGMRDADGFEEVKSRTRMGRGGNDLDELKRNNVKVGGAYIPPAERRKREADQRAEEAKKNEEARQKNEEEDKRLKADEEAKQKKLQKKQEKQERKEEAKSRKSKDKKPRMNLNPEPPEKNEIVDKMAYFMQRCIDMVSDPDANPTDLVEDGTQLSKEDLGTVKPISHLLSPLLKFCRRRADSEVISAVARFAPVLSWFIDQAHVWRFKVVVLCEVQRLASAMNLPRLSPASSLLELFFDGLYSAEVIEEQYFKWWAVNDDNTPGKTQAMFQVNAFLAWLSGTSLLGDVVKHEHPDETAKIEEEALEESEEEEEEFDDIFMEANIPKRNDRRIT